jgi:hypothetical protein
MNLIMKILKIFLLSQKECVLEEDMTAPQTRVSIVLCVLCILGLFFLSQMKLRARVCV